MVGQREGETERGRQRQTQRDRERQSETETEVWRKRPMKRTGWRRGPETKREERMREIERPREREIIHVLVEDY